MGFTQAYDRLLGGQAKLDSVLHYITFHVDGFGRISVDRTGEWIYSGASTATYILIGGFAMPRPGRFAPFFVIFAGIMATARLAVRGLTH